MEEDARNVGAPDNWRATLMNALLGTHSSVLRDIAGTARTLSDAHARASQATAQGAARPAATTANAALGSGTDSLVYTPMSPCRFADTRDPTTGGGPIGLAPRQFDTYFTSTKYGGTAGCYVPGSGQPAIVADVTLVAPATSAGYLTVRPAGLTNVTSWLNFNQSGPTVAVANQGLISTGLISVNNVNHYAFEVFVSGGPADVVIDFFGYFSAAAPTALDCVAVKSSIAIQGSSSSDYTAPACPSGYIVTAPYCFNGNNSNVFSGGSGTLNNDASSGSTAFCQFMNLGSPTATVLVGATCCRVP